MDVFESISSFSPPNEGLAIFIGKADALHLGHIALINETLKLADELNTASGILSLIPDSDNPISDMESHRMVLTEDERREFLSNWPVTYLVYQKMTRDFTDFSAEKFVTEVLHDKMKVRGIVVGWDFRFGWERKGDADLLEKMAGELGFHVRIIEPVMLDGQPIKTSRIREIIEAGEFREAQRFLGYPFFVSGIVAPGKGLGHKIGFPTANIQIPPEKLLPRRGVYIARGLFDNSCYWGLANVGIRPTLEDKGELLVEIWLKDFDGDLVGKKIKVEFFRFLRDEIKFGSLEKLTEQMEKDKKSLYDFLSEARK